MPRERDIEQIQAIERKYKMSEDQRQKFSQEIHDLKKAGFGGTKNERGDFTYSELDELAREFLEIDEPT